MDKKSNPFNSSTDYELYSIFDRMVDLKNKVDVSFAKAERLAGFADDMQFTKYIPFEASLPSYKLLRNPSQSGLYFSAKRGTLANITAEVTAAIASARTKIAETVALNAPIVEHNTNIRKQIVELMSRIGLFESYTTYEYPTSRSKTRKSVTHTAGYITDISRVMPVYNTGTRTVDIYEADFRRWLAAEKVIEEKEMIAADEKAVNQNILGNPALVARLMAAGVNILDEVQKAIPGQKGAVVDYCIAKAVNLVTSKDKYLKLGYALVYVDGIRRPTLDRVTSAMAGFIATTETDSDIMYALQKCIAAWPSDNGRSLINDSICGYEAVMSHVEDKHLVEQLFGLLEIPLAD